MTTRPTRWAAAVAGGMMVANTATAFYFLGWPGAGTATPPSLISPKAPPEANPPSARVEEPPPPPVVPPGTTPPGTTPPPTTENPPGGSTPPAGVPEPATGVAVVIGLAVLAARRRLRMK